MSTDPHTVNSGPRSRSGGPESASTPLAGVSRRREGSRGAQTGAQEIPIMETGVKPYRILVTGSRTWGDITTIAAAIEQTLIDSGGRPVIVVHGACPSGADRHADRYARWLRGRGCSVDVEQHPAQGHPTEDFGPWPECGPFRNKHMVNLGADLCLAFIGPCTSPRCHRPRPHPSHGASHCARLAEQAGIPVRRFTA